MKALLIVTTITGILAGALLLSAVAAFAQETDAAPTVGQIAGTAPGPSFAPPARPIPDAVRDRIKRAKIKAAHLKAARIKRAKIKAAHLKRARIKHQRLKAARLKAARIKAARIKAARIKHARRVARIKRHRR